LNDIIGDLQEKIKFYQELAQIKFEANHKQDMQVYYQAYEEHKKVIEDNKVTNQSLLAKFKLNMPHTVPTSAPVNSVSATPVPTIVNNSENTQAVKGMHAADDDDFDRTVVLKSVEDEHNANISEFTKRERLEVDVDQKIERLIENYKRRGKYPSDLAELESIAQQFQDLTRSVEANMNIISRKTLQEILKSGYYDRIIAIDTKWQKMKYRYNGVDFGDIYDYLADRIEAVQQRLNDDMLKLPLE
jgi:hypothetical protein